ncbi:MAG: DUF2828 family protein [Lachnospiraceae bacterium]|nr:DUF2828 family protein [Lachnospiraceae bacterium]
MLEFLKRAANRTYTENSAVTYSTSLSDCLDLFATIGALRNAREEEIIKRFIRAYAENPDMAMKILFYARDIRGGLGERRVFKLILGYLANNEQETVKKNIENVAEYGRYDDLLVLIDTPCEDMLIEYFRNRLDKDLQMLEESGEVSLLAKWLPSINTSNRETVFAGKRIAKKMGYTYSGYRKVLSVLRAHIRIIENNLRENDYSFEYEKQPSKALFKYRKAFHRNDRDRYSAFLEKAKVNHALIHTGTLTPYDIVAPVITKAYRREGFTESEREAMDVTWNALENYVGSENALAVVDGSGSMYSSYQPIPAAVAESLGIYFAEHNTGAFRGHFITFSAKPQLVEVKGRDIVEKMHYCMGFNECSNTDLAATFDLILRTAKSNRLSQKDMPTRLYIISDMEFDRCADNASLTNFEYARREYELNGYKLPELVFWNVCSRNRQQPVAMNEKGVILVSGCSPQIFSMLRANSLDPYSFMIDIITSERYERIVA